MTKAELQEYSALIRLSHKIMIYCPSESNGILLPNRQDIVDYVLGELSAMCGGATASDALGVWQSPGGRLVKEHISLAYAFTDDLADKIDSLLTLALWVKDAGKQESVAFEIDGELYLL